MALAHDFLSAPESWHSWCWQGARDPWAQPPAASEVSYSSLPRTTFSWTLNICKRWRLHLSGKPVPMLPHPQSKKMAFFSFSFSCVIFCVNGISHVSSAPISFCSFCLHWEEFGYIFASSNHTTIVPFTQFHFPNTGDDFSVHFLYILLIPGV